MAIWDFTVPVTYTGEDIYLLFVVKEFINAGVLVFYIKEAISLIFLPYCIGTQRCWTFYTLLPNCIIQLELPENLTIAPLLCHQRRKTQVC